MKAAKPNRTQGINRRYQLSANNILLAIIIDEGPSLPLVWLVAGLAASPVQGKGLFSEGRLDEVQSELLLWVRLMRGLLGLDLGLWQDILGREW